MGTSRSSLWSAIELVTRMSPEACAYVPDDVSIVTFDGVALQVGVDPFYTVAVQPEHEMAKQVTELLLARLSGNGLEAAQDIILPAEIRKRQSSAAAPRTRSSAR